MNETESFRFLVTHCESRNEVQNDTHFKQSSEMRERRALDGMTDRSDGVQRSLGRSVRRFNRS